MSEKIGSALLIASALLAGSAHAGEPSAVAQSNAPSLLHGAFSEEQASNGKALYMTHCAGCHGSAMRGSPGGRAILGMRFRQRWQGLSVSGLYEYIRALMPPGKAGSLADEEYLSIVTYILSRNGYPSGPQPLPPDAETLANIIIEPLQATGQTSSPPSPQ